MRKKTLHRKEKNKKQNEKRKKNQTHFRRRHAPLSQPADLSQPCVVIWRLGCFGFVSCEGTREQ